MFVTAQPQSRFEGIGSGIVGKSGVFVENNRHSASELRNFLTEGSSGEGFNPKVVKVAVIRNFKTHRELRNHNLQFWVFLLTNTRTRITRVGLKP